MMKKLIVMDHKTQAISIYPYDENVWESPQHFHSDEEGEVFPVDSNTSWMLVDEVKITMH